MSVRQLVTELILSGVGVIDQLNEVKALTKDMVNMVAKVRVEAETSGAAKNLATLRGQIAQVQAQAIQAKANMKDAASGFGEVGQQGAALQAQLGTLASGFGDVGNAMEDVYRVSNSSSKGILENWKAVESQLKKISAVTGGITMASIYEAAGIQNDLGTIGYTSGSEAQKVYKEWIKQAASIQGVSMNERASLAKQTSKYLNTISPEQQRDFLEMFEKEGMREGLNSGDLESVIRMMGSGRISMLSRYMPAMGIDTDKIEAEAEKMAKLPESLRGGKTQEQIASELFVKEFMGYAKNKKQESLGGKTLEEADIQADTTAKVTDAMTDMGSTLGDTLLPLLTMFAQFLQMIVGLMLAFPDGTRFVAVGVALTFITTSAILAGAALKSSLVTLGLWPAASNAAAAGLGVLRGAMTLLVAHPMMAAFLVLATILMIVAERTGFLQKALQALEGLDVGQVLAGGIQFALGLWDQAMGYVTAFEDKIKGLKNPLGGGSLGSMAFTMVFPPVLLAVLLTNLPEILKYVTSLLQRADVLGDVQGTAKQVLIDILKLLQPFIDVGMYIYHTLSDFWEWVQTLPEKLKATILGGALQPGMQDYSKGIPEEKYAEDIAYARSLVNQDHEKLFHYDDATIKAAITEALTGVKPDWDTIGGRPADMVKYQQLVDTIRNHEKYPDRTPDQTVAPRDTSNGKNPFYDPAKTNSIKGPGGIEIRTKPADEIRGEQDVEGTFQMAGRMAWDAGSWAVGKLTGHAKGGDVIASGAAVIHEGEQIEPAQVVSGAETILQKFVEVLGPSPVLHGGVGGNTYNIVRQENHFDSLIAADKIERSVDVDDMVWRARGKLDDLVTRASAQMRG